MINGGALVSRDNLIVTDPAFTIDDGTLVRPIPAPSLLLLVLSGVVGLGVLGGLNKKAIE